MQTAFGVLAQLKFLRGTWLDPFGYTEERRTERELIGRYRDGVTSWLARLNDATKADALAFARSPEDIKGYGHVKARHLEAVLKDRKSTRLNSSHVSESRMPSSA